MVARYNKADFLNMVRKSYHFKYTVSYPLLFRSIRFIKHFTSGYAMKQNLKINALKLKLYITRYLLK